MAPKPLVTTGVASMFAGEIFLVHPNLESHLVGFVWMFVLWLAFGISAAFLGDWTYNQWQASTNNALIRFGMLWAVIAVIFAAAFAFAKLVFLVA